MIGCERFADKIKPKLVQKTMRVLTVIILIIIFLCPLLIHRVRICLIECLGFSMNQDFYTFWIALFGCFGIAYNIVLANKRNNNQDKQLRDNRLSKAGELLGNENESARINGVYLLYSLAKEYPLEYREIVFDILCSHIRTITSNAEYKTLCNDRAPNEVQTVLNLLFVNKEGINLFKGLEADLYASYLNDTNLRDAHFENAFLNCVHFENAILDGANFKHADVESAFFNNALMPGANFESARLAKTSFENAVLPHVKFMNASFTNQSKLMAARFEGKILEKEELAKDAASFKNANIYEADFLDASLEGVDLKEAQYWMRAKNLPDPYRSCIEPVINVDIYMHE